MTDVRPGRPSAGTPADVAASPTWQAGLEMRKSVLGAAHVERSLSNASEFSQPIQDLVTEYCWGAVWTRPALDRRTRSLLNIVMLNALNRGHELGVHVRGAITNGVTVEEIQEALIQAAIYVGVPASLESFRIAEKALTDMLAEEQAS